jgi:GDP-mannose 4,6 dehydratase
VKYDESYERPSEVDALIGDPSLAQQLLGWKAQTHAPELAKITVEADIAAASDSMLGTPSRRISPGQGPPARRCRDMSSQGPAQGPGIS